MGKTSRDKRDIYYRIAKEQGWRARSAFKLLQIQEAFDIFRDVKHVVDLCAAPGSWSQVLSKHIHSPNQNDPQARIVAVDLQTMAPLEGVIQLKGDITEPKTAEEVIDCFGGNQADLVVCDGAPDVIGLFDIDEYVQHQLVIAALEITARILKPGGTLVAKVFRGRRTAVLTSQLSKFFGEITIAKPKCSRDSSLEAFAVCRGYKAPGDFCGISVRSYLDAIIPDLLQNPGKLTVVPFVACGGDDAFDSDKTYPLQLDALSEYKYRQPVQSPIHPPYEVAQKMRKEHTLAKIA